MNVAFSAEPQGSLPNSPTSIRTITLAFHSYHPEEDEGMEYPESNKEELVVFTAPHFQGSNYALIEWNCKPCGIRLTDDAAQSIHDLNEIEIENPWCPEITPTHGYIKAYPKDLAKFRQFLAKLFETRSSWKTKDGSPVEVVRARVAFE